MIKHFTLSFCECSTLFLINETSRIRNLFVGMFCYELNTTFVFAINFCKVRPNIVIRNGKIVWKDGPYCWCFCLNLKYSGWQYRAYIKTAKNGHFCEEFLSENDIEAVLATLCCYDHGTKASEAVQKIATDQKEYRKCSSCVIICWIAKIYLSNKPINLLVTRIPPM